MDPFMRNVLIGFVVLSILALILIILMILSGQDKLAPSQDQEAYVAGTHSAPTMFDSGTGII